MMHGDIEPDPIDERPRSTKQRTCRGFFLVLILALVGSVILYVCRRGR